MSNLDATFELLSSMSPKIKNKDSRKKFKRSPHKLALKDRIRRSSIYDKVPHSHHVRDASVIILDDSIDNDESPIKPRIIKGPIIISSSSEESEQEGDEETDIQINEEVQVKSKLIDIDNWLSDNEKVNGYSEVFSFKHNSCSDSDDEKSTSNNLNDNPREEKSPSGTWKVVSIESKLGKEPLRNSFENDDFDNPEKTPISNRNSTKLKSQTSFSDEINESNENEAENIAEKLLDDLYGTSWRENKEQILMKSEPRKQKSTNSFNRLNKTESKKRNVKVTKANKKFSWENCLIKNRDSDTSDGESSSSESYKNSENRQKLNFSDCDDDSYFSSSNMTPPSINRVNTKSRKVNYSSNSSNDINFSESDNDSLGTRVKKKLSKTAKVLQNDKSKKKEKKSSVEDNKMKNKEVPKKKTENNTQLDNKKTKAKAKNDIKTSQFDFDSNKLSFLKSLSGGVPPWQCDPDAHFFKTNYKTKKIELAKKLFDLYNQRIFNNAIPDDTQLQWNDRMRGTAGFCYNRRITKSDGKVIRSCRIALASKVLDSADRLRDTLVHEMCHAATWLVNNVADGHGPYWKSWANKAMSAFPELPPIKRCHDYHINTKYTYKCVDCGYSIGRHSKSLDIERKRCGYCYGKFEIFINKVTKNGEKKVAAATPNKKPSGFALFVKENYNLVKCQSMKHGDVMKVLGQKFSELKVNQNIN